MSIFDEIAGDVSAAVDDVFGETLRIIPMRKGRYEDAVADPDRQPRDLVGAFVDTARDKHVNDNRLGKDFNREITAAETYASFDESVFAGVMPKKGDRLQRTEKIGTPTYEIVEPKPSGRSRIKLVLAVIA